MGALFRTTGCSLPVQEDVLLKYILLLQLPVGGRLVLKQAALVKRKFRVLCVLRGYYTLERSKQAHRVGKKRMSSLRRPGGRTSRGTADKSNSAPSLMLRHPLPAFCGRSLQMSNDYLPMPTAAALFAPTARPYCMRHLDLQIHFIPRGTRRSDCRAGIWPWNASALSSRE